jgi:hypothetical protein
VKVSNFKLEKTTGKSALDKVFTASIDVTTGILFWKKTERKQIMREYAGYWYFTETGDFTPGRDVENLARAWKGKTGQEC